MESVFLIFNNWQSFYTLTGTAAATLAGLLFIAITFGVGVNMEDISKGVRIWVEPTLNDFIEVLMISCLALVPGVRAAWLGVVLVVYSFWRGWRWWEVYRWFVTLKKPNDLQAA